MPGLGRIFSPDPQDRHFLLRRLLTPATKADIGDLIRSSWRFRGPILNQGETGTCVGHAWRDFLRCAPVQTKTGPSAWDLYRGIVAMDEYPSNDDEATLPDNDPGLDDGTSVRAGAQYLTTKGRLKSYVWAFTLADANAWLLRNGPLVLGTNWYDGMFTPDAQGVVRIKKAGDTIAGGHAYLARGTDLKRGMVRCVNSWGTTWGLAGQFLLPFEDLERLISEDGEACAAVEQRLVAKPA